MTKYEQKKMAENNTVSGAQKDGISRIPLITGVYTIQQMSNKRYVDAYQSEGKDFAMVTRKKQDNDTQKWILTLVAGNTYTIKQKSSHRFVDAYQSEGKDYAMVTRKAQNDDTQLWILTPVGDDPIGTTTYTIQQKSSGRYVDAYQDEGKNFAMVTRERQNNSTQKWTILHTPR
jgi:Ricin-type beta-trefoil lectin domain-like